MQEGRKAPRKVYLMQRIGIPMELLDEFSQFWRKNTLPFWERNGAKLIVAATNLAGGPSNEITRIFEFENIHHWERVQEATWDWWEREEGAGRAIPPAGYVKYLASHVQILLRAIYGNTSGAAIRSTGDGPSEGKKAPRGMYVLHRISVPYERVDEFNQFWKKNLLRFWQEQGAKLIVAGVNIVGGPANEITHVFEVDHIHHWEKIQEATWDGWEREEGQERTTLPREALRYVTTTEQKLLRAVY